MLLQSHPAALRARTMRFEVSYRTGMAHEVQLPGPLVVIGRDPGCDLVLNDEKCSRRHAVVEDGLDGLSVRDSGSANGVYVNGRKVERSLLKAGDTIRIGDVRVKVLPELGETVVMAPDDMEPLTASGMSRPEPPGPARREPLESGPARGPLGQPSSERARPGSGRLQAARPLTVTVLSALWALSVPFSVAAPVFAARRAGVGALGWALAGGSAFVFAASGTTLALGLRALAPWARRLQIAAAVLGLVVCPLTLASLVVLFYMARPEVKAAFEGKSRGEGAADGTAEPTFTVSLLGLLALGIALTAGAVLLMRAGG